MLSALSPPFTPAATAAQVVDHDLVRQKRLQKFLLNCAKAGVQTPLPLDATQQDNATFDTMLEAAAECEAIGIPPPHRPYASASTLPLPPTPKTGAPNSIWGVFTNDQTSWTPDLPEDDGGDEFPNFPEVFASINSPFGSFRVPYHSIVIYRIPILIYRILNSPFGSFRVPRRKPAYGQSPYSDSGFQRV